MTTQGLFRQAVASGIVTLEEIDWLAQACPSLPSDEIGSVTQLVDLLENGVICLGCRLNDAPGRADS